MHKFSYSDSFPKLHSIVSSIGTFNYNLACFLCKLLLANFRKDYTCNNTFYFASQIKNENIYRNYFASYNVTSLFTNITLQETIDIAMNLIFNHKPNLNTTKNELKTLFLVATSQIHFLLNSKFYNQIDGVLLWFLPLLILLWVLMDK